MESRRARIEQDFPEINLDREDKIRIMKGLILILIFSSISKIFFNYFD